MIRKTPRRRAPRLNEEAQGYYLRLGDVIARRGRFAEMAAAAGLADDGVFIDAA